MNPTSASYSEEQIEYFTETLQQVMKEMKHTLQHEMEWCNSMLNEDCPKQVYTPRRSVGYGLDRIEELTELLDQQSTHLVDQIASTALQTAHSYVL